MNDYLRQGDSCHSSPRPASAPSLEDWMEQGRCLRDEWFHLRTLTVDLMFRIGDWWCTGEREWPHESSQMMDEFSYWQVTKYGSIAARVPPENRLSRDNLAIEHYRVAAQLPPEVQLRALSVASEANLSASGLRAQLEEKGALPPRTAPETHECPLCGANHRVKGAEG